MRNPEKARNPETFVRIFIQFYDGMEVRVNFQYILSNLFVISGLKQGDILASTLITRYYPIVFQIAFTESTEEFT